MIMNDDWYYDDGEAERKDNGDIYIKFSNAEIEYGKQGIHECFQCLDNEFEKIGLFFFGEDFCVNNFTMGTSAYCCGNDMVYTVMWCKFEDVLLAGKTLVLYGRKPEVYDYVDLYHDGFFEDCEDGLKFLLGQLEKEEGYEEEIEQVREDLSGLEKSQNEISQKSYI